MHELGLVVRIMETVESIAQERKLTQIDAVTLEIGEVSSVLPDYIADCWNWARGKSELLKTTALKIERLPAVTRCLGCGRTYATVEYGRTCPYCRSEKTVLVCGNEFSIKEIEAL